MLSKRKAKTTFKYISLLALIILILISKYPVWVRAFEISIIILLSFNEVFGYKLVRNNTILMMVIFSCIVISFVLNLLLFYPCVFHYNYTNIYPARWVDHQNLYKYDRAYDNHVILADMFCGKTVYVPSDMLVIPFVETFSKQSIVLCDDKKPNMHEFDYASRYIDMGYVSVSAMAYIFSQDDVIEQWSTVTENAEIKPKLYFGSKNVVDESELYFFSDENYNLFVITMEEYQELLRNEK